MLAIKADSYNCLKLLRTINCIDWNKENSIGNTPAIITIKSNNIKCFKTLLNINAVNWNIHNKRNESPLTISIKHENDFYFVNLLNLEKIEIDTTNLKKQNLLKKASGKVTRYIRFKTKTTARNTTEDRQNIYFELLHALKNNFNKLYIKILLSTVTNDDIKNLVIHSINIR